MTDITPKQLEVWNSFKQVSRRADLEVRATMLELDQLKIVAQFKQSKGLPLGFDPAAIASRAKSVYDRNEKLKNAIAGVELGKLGVRFTGNDIDIMAPPGSSSDLTQQYRLDGLPLIIAVGIVVGTAVLYMAYLRRDNDLLNGEISALKDDADSMLCADPNSAQCREWKEAKTSAGYAERENLIDTTVGMFEALPDTVKKLAQGAAIGLLVAAVAVAGFMIWDKKRSRSE